MISLVVLDMAGTTIDEHGDVYRALSDCVTETGATVMPEDLQAWMGADKIEAITALLKRGGGDSGESVVSACFDRFRELLRRFYAENPPVALPGVEAALREFKRRGIRVALTTGFSRDVAEPLLDQLGWRIGSNEFLDTVVCADEVAAGRPAPYMIHRAMERTGVLSVSEVCSAGDTVVDVQAATNAGAAMAVGVLTGKLNREDFEAQPHTHIIDGVTVLPALI